MIEETGVSQRRAGLLVGLSRSSLIYVGKRPAMDAELKNRLTELAQERRRFGYRRIHAMLHREGFEVNHKRVYRLYREEGLVIKRRRKRKGVSVERQALVLPDLPNDTWSMDFVMDSLSDGRRLKTLTIVDDFIKESLDIAVARSITDEHVTRIMDNIAQFKGYPTSIRTDQGPEFTGRALDQWAYQHGVQLKLIEPGKPIQNAYIESFNGKYRDECLNEHWFTSVNQAIKIFANWRQDYNENRPHSALNYKTPSEFAAEFRWTERTRKSIN